MKQVVRMLSTYSADLFGINSVLYELGGLVVMHDASGCNSTYNTHDEPRWYTMESMVYISGLLENDVILGNDNKLIDDICEVATETKPRFIAISAAMIAHFMGVDIKGIAKVIEKRTGIPTFAFGTNAMDTYIAGGNMAYKALIGRFCDATLRDEAGADATLRDEAGADATLRAGAQDSRCNRTNDLGASESGSGKSGEARSRNSASARRLSVNLLGVTPLDFSVVGNVEELHDILLRNDIEVNCCMTMGCIIDDISHAGAADVNVLCSSIAEDGARLLEEMYGTPCVTGLPIGIAATKRWIGAIRNAADDGVSRALDNLASTGDGTRALDNRVGESDDSRALADYELERTATSSCRMPGFTGSERTIIIGEPVFASSLRLCLEEDFGFSDVRIICPTERTLDLLRPGDTKDKEEETFEKLFPEADVVIADPIYKRILGQDSSVRFINFPHEAYSGRMYRSHIPVFVGTGIVDRLESDFTCSKTIEINDIMKANVPFARKKRY